MEDILNEQVFMDTLEAQYEVIQIQNGQLQAKDEKIEELENEASRNRQADKIRREKGKQSAGCLIISNNSFISSSSNIN